jgi:hypothetical protein
MSVLKMRHFDIKVCHFCRMNAPLLAHFGVNEVATMAHLHRWRQRLNQIDATTALARLEVYWLPRPAEAQVPDQDCGCIIWSRPPNGLLK